jgi:hypothetical protein
MFTGSPMNASTLRGFAWVGLFRPGSSALPSAGRLFVLGLISATPASANLVLISEARSVTVSYWGSGAETHSSDGTFGLFEAVAIGTPFGGGSLRIYQKSNITSSGFTLEHQANDHYGPGGYGLSAFQFTFGLVQDTRITISGVSHNFARPGLASLSGYSLVWGPPFWHNYLEFDQVLAAGVYTFSSNQTVGDGATTNITLRAAVVPDGGTCAWMLAIGVLSLVAIRGRILSPARPS